jgi:hypothetical protein
VGVVEEPVEGSGDGSDIAEQPSPVVDGAVRGDEGEERLDIGK